MTQNPLSWSLVLVDCGPVYGKSLEITPEWVDPGYARLRLRIGDDSTYVTVSDPGDCALLGVLSIGDARGDHAVNLLAGVLWRHVWSAPPLWLRDRAPLTCAFYTRAVAGANAEFLEHTKG